MIQMTPTRKRSDGSQAAMFAFALLIAVLVGLLSIGWVHWWQSIIITLITLFTFLWLNEV